MTIEGATSERVYLNLKASLLAGQLDPHTRLDFVEVARQLDVSTTPVREGAMRLLGEGLLEPSPRGGLRPVPLTEYRLRALLDLHERLVLLAIDWPARAMDRALDWPEATHHEDLTRRLFAHLADATGNREFETVLARVADLLAPFRRSETSVLIDAAAELGQLHHNRNDRTRLRRVIRSYHRRRLANVPQLAWAAISYLGE